MTTTGEIAENKELSINCQQIQKEEIFDGYYGACTNLEDNVSEIININKGRWEIEESFRIMKTELKSRPVYLSKDERIKAHFATCFMALLLFRLLESKLESKYTCDEIIETLRGMNFLKEPWNGYIPTYKRTEITDSLHNVFGFRTDYEIVPLSDMREIQRLTKQSNWTQI